MPRTGAGILVGLLLATLPLIVVLSYLAVSKKWGLNVWQSLAIVSPLLAFLVVGLIVSTKIGGGGDLHNMDMFLIGLLFTAVIAWERGGRKCLADIDLVPAGLKLALLLLFALPGCRDGLALGFGFHQDTCSISKHIGQYSTRDEKYVNGFTTPKRVMLQVEQVPIWVVVISTSVTMI